MPVIKIENLGKKYLIRHQTQANYNTLRDAITKHVKKTRKKAFTIYNDQAKHLLSPKEEFWAVKDINLEIEQGDRIGIIGKNGAGKSTLLKLLTMITNPTTGRISINGKVASLLEVGTGFHPELTGRENIFLNGTILGMRRAEIKKKFDDIVDFAEVEKFLDTPVKRYSSGMYVRLAFAVAAHLNSDILIVDEVLAVGDIQFQKKCLNKMKELRSDEKTVLLVSHNMSSILSLSNKCILLAEGKLIEKGVPQKVISVYTQSYRERSFGQTDLSSAEHYGNGKARFLSIFMKPYDQNGNLLSFPLTGCNIEFMLKIKAFLKIKSTNVALIIYDKLGNRLIDVNTLIKGDSLSLSEGQEVVVKFNLQNVLLKPDTYTVGLWIGIANVADIDGVNYATSFEIEARRKDILYTNPFPGVYSCAFNNEIQICK